MTESYANEAPSSGSVSRILFPPSLAGGDHSSSPTVTRGLQHPTGGLRPGQPQTPPYLVLLRVGFSVPGNVTTPAVRSYRTFSPLPPPLARKFGGLFSVALSLRSPSLAVSQHTTHGVRTFLPDA